MKGDSTLFTREVSNEYFREYITKAQNADVRKRKKPVKNFFLTT
jgi:hypothetical protein